MKKVLVCAMCALMILSLNTTVNAYQFSTTGSEKSYADSYGTTVLYWNNTEGTCKYTAEKKYAATVSVSLNGSTWASSTNSNLAAGKYIKATKDVGYKTNKLYGRITH